jgi:hypothetical protein
MKALLSRILSLFLARLLIAKQDDPSATIHYRQMHV